MSELRKGDSETYEAIYNLNKHAKKYAELADKNYRMGKKATSRANSIKKKALYGVKSRALNRCLLDGKKDLENAEWHEINGDRFVCLYFNDENNKSWSFHMPENELLNNRLDTEQIKDETIQEFNKTAEKEHSDKSLKECLIHLKGRGINANEYLEEKRVSYGSRAYFVGWDYL